ncbi:hypothetical protein HJG60_008625 [Phyllostomus discolor]|uniref:Sperm acrosome-associated protein 7 n=1 Tax=Phyllostomus discolor TaxID=89673 RepID=A0A833YZB0_9CHIR|nr:hypothetical protein HJG60_008625 [Phyllostomus discolor]
MAANRGMTLFVLLLNCWQEAEVQSINMSSGPATEIPPRSIKQEDMPEVFDEILVQEILNPNKSTLPETQRPLEKSTKSTKKKTHVKMKAKTDTDKYHEKELSSENEDRISLNEEEKEVIYQLKNLTSLEKIIGNLRRALENTLKQKRKNQKKLFKGGKTHRMKKSLN